MIIYKVTNIATGKMYIGQTTQKIQERWYQHCKRHPSQKHRSYLYNAIQEYGPSGFVIEELCKADSIELLNTLEAYYINKFNTLAPNGYNLQIGGKSKLCHPDTKLKISNALKGRPIKNRQNGQKKGSTVSLERRKKISNTMKGKKQPWNQTKVLVAEDGRVFESVKSAAFHLKINAAMVIYLLNSGKPHWKRNITLKRL